MTAPDDRTLRPDDGSTTPPAPLYADGPPPSAESAEPHPPHPPFARTSDEYTDPPGHHRRGPNGPALDVGA